MYSSSVPWQVLSSNVGVGVLTAGWTLDVVYPDIAASRSFVLDVMFDSPFAFVPVVHLGLTGFDMDRQESSRLTLKAENVTEFGFQAVISTWDASRIFSVEFNWMAIGA
ncbi:H-type lectin domain-containing protein [Prosthecobacter sp.]|uniref:H-type lectin domain-containing protein n=1 Tax=Prosthecobacter sp. TaxID=1965333 RepID=UPI002489ED24|nr:H-type lectin domain-containing protein [Prosthecobacter sp.]MDI1313081.1 H-type lectin domain-containing protein [Prosthecobacter sp.]